VIENLSWPTAGGIGCMIASFRLFPKSNWSRNYMYTLGSILGSL
jgi:hypothetical protein